MAAALRSYSLGAACGQNDRVKAFVVSLVLVLVIVAGGLVRLLRRRREPMGTPEQLERARQRNRELEERERQDGEGG